MLFTAVSKNELCKTVWDNFLSLIDLNLMKIFSTTGFIHSTLNSLHKKWSFPLRICSVNVTKSAVHKKWTFPLRISSVIVTDLVAFTEEILHGKLHLFCAVIGNHCPKINWSKFLHKTDSFGINLKKKYKKTVFLSLTIHCPYSHAKQVLPLLN